jgi:hypothetical protein
MAENTAMPIMLTINQAAAEVEGLTPWAVKQMCIKGTLPHIRAGKKYLINKTVLFNVLSGKI